MGRILGKLLILVALLAMPVAMSTASARAPATDPAMDHGSMAHCPDSAPAEDVEPGIAACTMACAASLPAVAPSAPEPRTTAADALSSLPGKALVGVLLEIATPPPRIA